jgi:hypothetical protein
MPNRNAEDRIWLPNCVTLRRRCSISSISRNARPTKRNKSKDLIDALVGAVANLVESEDPIMLEEEGDRFPAWGSMHASRQDIRPKPPIEEKQLVEPTYGKGDKVFLDP